MHFKPRDKRQPACNIMQQNEGRAGIVPIAVPDRSAGTTTLGVFAAWRVHSTRLRPVATDAVEAWDALHDPPLLRFVQRGPADGRRVQVQGHTGGAGGVWAAHAVQGDAIRDVAHVAMLPCQTRWRD